MILFPDISPNIFSITVFGLELALRWYAMAYIAGILIGWRLALVSLQRPALWPDSGAPMTPPKWEDLITWIIIGVIIGGRLGYVLFYQPAYFAQNPGSILQVWQGGMAFHGGFLGVVTAVFIYCKRHSLPLASTADLLALSSPAGLLLGRSANFINAELWGRPTDLPWGVAFPGNAAQACGQLEGLCARHPSQLYEALLEGLVLGLVLLWLAYRRGGLKLPGWITGLFFAGYGISRFIVEFFRQPDVQFVTLENPVGLAWHLGGIGLTMGQVLSLPMIAVGVFLCLRARRRA
ncbi:MAG: prolipoprotein diacylglyceryl transferase [Rhodobacteraceae bacterium]|nr:prolipoprotein diacylglyceryl transferase [Paracoccaceae bacterium]